MTTVDKETWLAECRRACEYLWGYGDLVDDAETDFLAWHRSGSEAYEAAECVGRELDLDERLDGYSYPSKAGYDRYRSAIADGSGRSHA